MGLIAIWIAFMGFKSRKAALETKTKLHDKLANIRRTSNN
jgi:hypothetical protein